MERQAPKCDIPLKNQDDKRLSDNIFKLFRGKVRQPHERKKQTSVKDLKVGGTDIIGKQISSDLKKFQMNNCSIDGDILIARVGQRMLGRVGIVCGNFVLTNESVVTLRIYDPKFRMVVYEYLKSYSFIEWCKTVSRGTANYFITNRDFKNLVSKLTQNCHTE